MTSAVFTSPLDVLKTRLQSDYYKKILEQKRIALGLLPTSSLSPPRQAMRHFSETFQILFSIHKVEGWKALFRGLGPSMSGVVPAKAVGFYTYHNSRLLLMDYLNRGQEALWIDACAGTASGLVTSTVTNPIWVVKTRLQLDKSAAKAATGATAEVRKYKNSIDCAMKITKQEGFKGLYKGMGASYLGASEAAIQWVLYQQMKGYAERRQARIELSGKEPSVWDHTVQYGKTAWAAGTAKFVSAIVTYPHEVVRTRLRQAPMEGVLPKYTGILQCARLVVREEGLAAMYGGLTPHLLRTVPSAIILFGT
jgi:Mitochondrial carrier protein